MSETPSPGPQPPDQAAARTGDDRGHDGPVDAAFSALYAELHRLAESQFRAQQPGHTLQPTALVHEAFMRVAQANHTWQDETHVKAVAATAMRQILVDHARRRRADKRGGGAPRLALEEGLVAAPLPETDVVDLDEALAELTQQDMRTARVVELRFFGGLTIEETARVLGVSDATVSNDWRFARAWLAQRLGEVEG